MQRYVASLTNAISMCMANSDVKLIKELWTEHNAALFPEGFRAKDVSGIDFVMLDADVAGCIGACKP